jgi:hypothetical protein
MTLNLFMTLIDTEPYSRRIIGCAIEVQCEHEYWPRVPGRWHTHKFWHQLDIDTATWR